MKSHLFSITKNLLQHSTRAPAVTFAVGRQFSLGRYASSSINEKFTAAQSKLKTVDDQGNDVKLKLYGLFKQATVGKNTTKKPGMLDMVGKAKWDAWTAIGDISQEEAQKLYVELVDNLAADSQAKNAPRASEAPGLSIVVSNGIRLIKLNRPKKMNSLTNEMYRSITDALTEANSDDSTKIVVMTGTGDYFCSGNDLGNLTNVTDVKAAADAGKIQLQKYVASYIDLRKPLIVLVNGPAVGIAVTILGMADIVYATERATFTTPFSSLGQVPEACSSYTFPRIMGYAKANEMLLFNSKITAKQALEAGLLTAVFPDDSFEAETRKRVEEYAQLPVKSLVYSKDLVRGREREVLHSVNNAECDRIYERWQSEDCMNAIMKFFSRKK